MKLLLLPALLLVAQANSLDEARKLVEAGRTAEAIDLLGRTPDDDPRRLGLLADLLARAGRVPEAEQTLALALRSAPDRTELVVARASLLFQLSRYDEARAVLEPVLAGSPDHPFAHYYLGAILLRTGDPVGAARHAERALGRMTPDAPGGGIPRHAEAFHPGSAAEGGHSGAGGDRILPRAEALHLLGEARLRVGDDAPGEAALREALEVAPWHPGPAYRLGQHLVGVGRAAEGARLLDRFARARRAAEAVELGIHLLPRDPVAAERQFREALRVFPGHLPAARLLARSRQ